MLRELGLKRCAYDWRENHVPTFEEEILEYKKNDIEYFAFWGQHESAFELFKKHKIKPQIWHMLGDFPGPSQDEKVAQALESLKPIIKRTSELGCQLALYNHGGWGGEPENMVAVCQRLHQQGNQHVGIVYNFHHGHSHIKDFAHSLELMKPYLLCLNLNGMVDLNSPKYNNQQSRYKILPIGSGYHERDMIREIIARKYEGPIGILGHVAERDVAIVLRENIEGLQWILEGGKKPDWLTEPEDVPAATEPIVSIDASNKALDTRLGFLNVDAGNRFNQPGFSIRVRARVFDKENFNIFVAKNPKSSNTHWEFYSYAKSGELSFYIPGYQPAEIKSGVNVADGKWHDMSVEFADNQVTISLDGKEIKKQQIKKSSLQTTTEGPLTIGSLASQLVGCNGQIDQLEINEIGRYKPIEIGKWSFDNAASADEIADESENSLPTDFVQTGFAADYLAKWTPKSRQNSRFPYENETDAQWVDHRFSNMDTGPTFNQSIKIPGRGIVPKAIAVKASNDDQAHFLFNSERMSIDAVWTGEYLALPPARFGVLQTPSIAGSVKSVGSRRSRWKIRTGPEQDYRVAKKSDFHFLSTSLPNDRVVFNYKIGDTEISESINAHRFKGSSFLQRQMAVKRSTDQLTFKLFDIPRDCEFFQHKPSEDHRHYVQVWKNEETAFVLKTNERFVCVDAQVWLDPKTTKEINSVVAWYANVSVEQVDEAIEFLSTKATSFNSQQLADYPERRWGVPITTKGTTSGDDSPFVVDTITVPYENRYNALMFTSGLDFLPDGRAFVCTVHGDVWLVSGIDDGLNQVTWQRFATGLYHPLGLKIVDGHPIVMCRDRLTKLIDVNGDGEADVYENFNDDLVVTGENHAYAMSLETDPDGNFYFIKSGSSPPHGGTMLKLSADGKELGVFATGYRHANGLGVSPTGIVTSADNEGNWIPSTRIDVVQKGGFYGHMATHRRENAPATYDPPLIWLPRSMDNSAGGQVWVQSNKWGSLDGTMIHLSYGRCTANVVLPQQLNDKTWQAASYKMDLPLFLSGAMRGRFNPVDGQLYVCGLDGWQTAAVRDGCFQRVRATGKPFCLPVGFTVARNKIRIEFSQPLDKSTVADLNNWQIEQWNYRWSEDYGSDHYSVKNPDKVGHDSLVPLSADLGEDGKTVVLTFEHVQPVMQMNIRANLKTAAGSPVPVDIYNTINEPVK